MPAYDLSPEAHTDLDEIADSVGEHGPEAARATLNDLFDRFELLADFPHMGRSRDYAPDLRSSAHGSLVIFYRPTDDGVEIVRVLHGARDIESITRDGEP